MPGSMRLPLVVAVLATVASVAGILVPGVYRDEPLIASAWRVNDAVTLLVAAPLLVLASRRSSLSARLVTIGALHYMAYDYGFYLFGAVLNPLLLVYAAIVALSGWSLVLAARELDLDAVRERVLAAPAKPVAAWMLFVSAGLATTWTAQWLVALLRTTPPGRFDVTPEFIRVVAGLDLTMMVAMLVPGAVLLWRRRPWGFVLGAALNVSGALYNVVLAGGTLVQIRAGLGGAWGLLGLWIFLGAGCLACAARLLARGYLKQPFMQAR